MSHTNWEARYQAGDMPWEKGAPSPGLVDFLATHRNLAGKTVCVPGCGSGNDACELARYGFEVSGFDIAPSAISLSAQKASAAGIKAGFQLVDFLRDEPPLQFDWVFEHTLFCAIHPDERDDYVRALLRWLKPDGQFLAVNYLIVEDEEGPPWPTSHEEQWQRFSPHFDLLDEWTPRSYPNREGKERMFWWRRKAR